MASNISFTQYVAHGLSGLRYHSWTLWLMMYNYIKCIVFPMTLFGVLCACSGTQLTMIEDPDISSILVRAPVAFVWLCVLLLHFGASNQSRTESILEDTINKPWRPIPSGRISQAGMRQLFILLTPFQVIFSWTLGVHFPTIAHILLTAAYDDMKLADTGYFMRNLLIAFAYTCYTVGATSIATGLGVEGLKTEFYIWILIVTAQIFTTIHVQDLPDIEGDKAKGRRTIPIVFGEQVVRWSLVIPVAFWSCFFPIYWQCGIPSFTMTLLCGAYFCGCIFRSKSRSEHGFTWRMWSVWATLLYCLPALRTLGL